MKIALLATLIFFSIEIETKAGSHDAGTAHADSTANWYLQNPEMFYKDPIFFAQQIARCENCSIAQFVDALKSLDRSNYKSKKIDAVMAYLDASVSTTTFGDRGYSVSDARLLIDYVHGLKISKSSRNYSALNSRLKEKLADAGVVEFISFTLLNSRDQIGIKLRELSMNVSPSQFGETVAKKCSYCSGQDLVETFSEADSYNDQLDAMVSFIEGIGSRLNGIREADIGALESQVALIRNQLNQQVSPNQDRLRIQRAAEENKKFNLRTARKELDKRLTWAEAVLKNLRANYVDVDFPSNNGSEVILNPLQNSRDSVAHDAFRSTKVLIPN